MRITRVVDKHIDAIPLIPGPLDHGFHLCFLRHVHQLSHGNTASGFDLTGHPLGAGKIQIRGDHLGPFRGKAFGDGFPEARARSR